MVKVIQTLKKFCLWQIYKNKPIKSKKNPGSYGNLTGSYKNLIGSYRNLNDSYGNLAGS